MSNFLKGSETNFLLLFRYKMIGSDMQIEKAETADSGGYTCRVRNVYATRETKQANLLIRGEFLLVNAGRKFNHHNGT